MFSLEKYQKCYRNKKQKWNHSPHQKFCFWILFRNCKHFVIFPFMNFSQLKTDNDVITFLRTAFGLNGIGMMGGWRIGTTCISDEIMTPWGDYVVTIFFIKDLYTREFKLSHPAFKLKKSCRTLPFLKCIP